MIALRSDRIVAHIDPAAGGRLTSLAIDGLEILVSADDSPLGWGSYPMVPFAGRIRHGRFSFDGIDHELPATMGAHAIHGYGHLNPWTTAETTATRARIEIEIPEPWPFGGRAIQIFELADDRLSITMEVHADQPMPVTAGWHPWFRRQLDDASISPLELTFDAGRQYVRDDEGMPSGELIEPTDGPWDDCFTELGEPPVLRWSGGPTVRIEHDADHLVVYTEPDHAICVEPQTGPPDGVTLCPQIVTPSAPLAVVMSLTVI